jgi:4-hydroxyphenylacetate 3-monooxygenase
MVFDDVFVPAARIFYMQRTEVHMGLLQQLLPWAFYHILIRMTVKAEALAGIGALISEYLGRDDQHTQLQICELYGYLETLRAFLAAAEQNAVMTDGGHLAPNPTQITAGRVFAVDRHPQILQIVRELCGSGILMAPVVEDLTNPEIKADIDRYLVGPDTNTLDRYQLLNLAWEYAGDSFASRQLLFEMHNAGAQLRTKQRMAQSYDAEPLKRLAKDLAGIDIDGDGS